MPEVNQNCGKRCCGKSPFYMAAEAIPPKDLFQNGSNKGRFHVFPIPFLSDSSSLVTSKHVASGVYSEFDAEGIPTKFANAEELSAKKRKDLVKDTIAFAVRKEILNSKMMYLLPSSLV